MAHYLVSSLPTGDLAELKRRLESGEIRVMRPFGRALEHALTNARKREDGRVVWEEEDYCRPPLAQERAAVLDAYFADIQVEPVAKGEGWARTEALAPLWS